jgi:heat shock protein 4
MKIRSSVCDYQIGGRNFDDVIIEFLAETFQKKTGKDVRKNIKAVLKMQAAAEKAKKTLSPAGVNEVNISVECLADDMDCNALLTKAEFEKRAESLVNRLRAPVEQALREAGLTREQILECEIVGGSSRVNMIKRSLSEILGLDASLVNYGLKTTMNADEATSRGGALQCAMLSSRVKVKPFNIVDRLYYGIVASFEGSATSGDGEGTPSESKTTSVSLYQRGDEVPHKPRRLTFRNKVSDFTVTLSYDEASAAFLPHGESRFLSRCTIKIPPSVVSSANGNIGDVRVTWNLDKHGLAYVQSAQLMEELPYSAEEIAAAEAAAGKPLRHCCVSVLFHDILPVVNMFFMRR